MHYYFWLRFFFNFWMLSELHSLNLKLCSKQYQKIVLHLIVVPQQSSGWQHNYSTKTRQVGRANEQSIYSLMSIGCLQFLQEQISAAVIKVLPSLQHLLLRSEGGHCQLTIHSNYNFRIV
jgi:hypothetical protein